MQAGSNLKDGIHELPFGITHYKDHRASPESTALDSARGSSLKRSPKRDKDKDEDPFAGSDRGLKKRKTSKDAAPTTGPKAKESQSSSSKGDKSQSKSSGRSVQSEEPEFKVADLDMPQVKRRTWEAWQFTMIVYSTNLSGGNSGRCNEDTWSKVTRRRSTSPSQKLPNPESGKGTHTLHIKTLNRFIYVDNNGRNRLMQLDELYKFSDRTLTGLQTSLDDITKSIRMEYLPKRRWSTLEKKRANIMIKAIDKKLKERRSMRSLKKFVGGMHYGTDLRLLQRTI
ncbi:hypothetical protein Tco_0774755 [Tanacetum coccineum]|uniref:Uncharacterized protein n=1 Tax=Tanacetum coccineum TaxID=301880 RepID=A0ABQ4ZPD5_9ASTR